MDVELLESINFDGVYMIWCYTSGIYLSHQLHALMHSVLSNVNFIFIYYCITGFKQLAKEHTVLSTDRNRTVRNVNSLAYTSLKLIVQIQTSFSRQSIIILCQWYQDAFKSR